MIEPIADEIWTVPAPQTYLGIQVNTRMTICRFSDGGLVLISPIGLTQELRETVDKLGDVKAIIAPNLMHHLYIGEWITAYPDALSYGPLGLSKKRPDLSLSNELGLEYDERFGHELKRFPIAGIPKLNESLFLHRQSSTLIVTDFCFYMPKATGLAGLFSWCTRIRKAPRCEPSVRMLIRNKTQFRESLRPLRSVEINHLSMCHDYVLSKEPGRALKDVLDHLNVPVEDTPH